MRHPFVPAPRGTFPSATGGNRASAGTGADMTSTPPRSANDDLDAARRAARGYSAAVRAMENFLDRVSPVPDAAEIAEYATLAAREEATRAQRQDALVALGLEVPSVEE